MTLQKRWRVLKALLWQEWHEKTCAECSAKWLSVGPHHPELITICDDCEVENINRFMDFAEAEYQRVIRKGA